MRLLTLSNEQILSWLNKMDKDSKALKDDVLTMCWFMRGSLTYDDAMMLSSQDRKIIAKIIDKNLETTKKSGLPFF
jgi:hypothetical protein